jgi:hypothetical protein
MAHERILAAASIGSKIHVLLIILSNEHCAHICKAIDKYLLNVFTKGRAIRNRWALIE